MSKDIDVWREAHYGRYQVSSLGNVRTIHKRGTTYQRRTYIYSNGYRQLTLSYNGVKKICAVHRLVATAFHENPLNKPQVNHIDGNRLNNRADNLEWSTPKENSRHSHRTGLSKPSRGEASGASKLKDADVRGIRLLASIGVKRTDIAVRYLVSRTNIDAIINGLTWRHLL